jgi:hypothetical protein
MSRRGHPTGEADRTARSALLANLRWSAVLNATMNSERLKCLFLSRLRD